MISKISLNNATLKILATIFMVIDHIGVFLIEDASIAFYFRALGRISFPLFCYLAIEGIIHTRDGIKYSLRLIGLGLVMYLFQYYVMNMTSGNVFTTLGLSTLTIYFLREKKWKKLFALIPVAIIFICALDSVPFKNEYSYYGLIIILSFYLTYYYNKVYAKYICSNYGLDYETFQTTPQFMKNRNIISIILLVSINLFFYFLNPYFTIYLPNVDMYLQVYSILACLFIFFYNGKRGYNAPWFKWFFYGFYPLHLIPLYMIRIIMGL